MCERCAWVGSNTLLADYHDTEWGVPEYDSRNLWEKLILDGEILITKIAMNYGKP